MVAYCIENDKAIDDLTLDEFKSFSELFDNDIYDAISLTACVNQRKLVGGPAVETVKELIKKYKNA